MARLIIISRFLYKNEREREGKKGIFEHTQLEARERSLLLELTNKALTHSVSLILCILLFFFSSFFFKKKNIFFYVRAFSFLRSLIPRPPPPFVYFFPIGKRWIRDHILFLNFQPIPYNAYSSSDELSCN